jgi:septal ring-binding cell division protein DamX
MDDALPEIIAAVPERPVAEPPAAPGPSQPVAVVPLTAAPVLSDSERDRRRRVASLAIVGIALCAATLAASSWYRVGTGSMRAFPRLPARPLLWKAPAAAAISPPSGESTAAARPTAAAGVVRYIIQVASFEDELRAGQLVAQLAAAGYRAYETSFQLDGDPWWQVSVGAYATSAEAQVDLAHIRAIPGYEDATARAVNAPRR